MPPLPPFLLSFYIWADILWYGVSIWLIWVSWPSCVRSQDQPTGEWGMLESAVAVPALLTGPKAPLCYQHLPSHQRRAEHCQGCCGDVNSSSATPNTLTSLVLFSSDWPLGNGKQFCGGIIGKEPPAMQRCSDLCSIKRAQLPGWSISSERIR